MTWYSSPYFIFGCLVAYLVVCIWIVKVWGKSKATEEDYFVAGRNVGWFANSMTIMATLMSGGIFLGTVGWFYLKGVSFLGYGMAYSFMGFVLWFVGKRLYVVGKRFQYSTPQDFYGGFYQSDVLRLLGAIGSIIALVPYFASNAVAMGLILERFAGIPYFWGVIVLIVVGTGYTIYGGMRGVIYTDVFQGTISLLFGIVAVIALLWAIGGYGTLITKLPASHKFYRADAVTYGLFIGWFIFMMSHPPTLADRMTRMYTIRNLDHFRKNVVTTVGLLLLMTGIFTFLGLISYVVAGAGVQRDQAILVTIQKLSPWLMAWMAVVVWACGMSTLDSGLVGADVMLSKDIIKGYIKKDITEERMVKVGKYFMVLFAVFAVWVALARPPYIWFLIAMVVTYHMQFLPLMIGGMYWKRASKLGAEVGWALGVAMGVIFTFKIGGVAPSTVFGGWAAALPAGVAALPFNVAAFAIISYLHKPVPAEHRETFERAWAEEGV